VREGRCCVIFVEGLIYLCHSSFLLALLGRWAKDEDGASNEYLQFFPNLI